MTNFYSDQHMISSVARCCARIFLSLILGANFNAWAEPIKLGGTGSGLDMMRLLANAYSEQDKTFALSVMPNLGSTGGVKALAAGMIDIAVTSRALKPAELSLMLVEKKYGRTPLALVTSRRNPPGLSAQQVENIISGKTATWPDGTPIRLVMRPNSDGDSDILSHASKNMRQAINTALLRHDIALAITDQESAELAEKLPGSFGTASLVVLLTEKRALYPIALDGVSPSIEALSMHRYPLYKDMRVLTQGQPSDAVAHFIDFIFSPKGRELLAHYGHWVTDQEMYATSGLP